MLQRCGRRFSLTLLMLAMLIPAGSALAHGDETDKAAFHQEVKAGPYNVTFSALDWPLQAKKSNRFIVRPEGGIAERKAQLTFEPGTDVGDPRILRRTLTPYPGVEGAWAVEIEGIPLPGTWNLRIQITGEQGACSGAIAGVTVNQPSAFPVWLGWAIGLFPLYGLIWFGVREARRFRLAAAADGGARA